jgi:hypothetical protein
MTENPIPWRVIRAAPEMLEALEDLSRVFFDAIDGQIMTTRQAASFDRARAAIAKAKGEKE